MKNVLKVQRAFTDGFKQFLKQINLIDVKDEEVDEVAQYVEQHLESTVGYWTEEEVEKNARDWRLIKQMPITPPVNPIDSNQNSGGGMNPPYTQPVNPVVVTEKRTQAKNRIATISDLNDAKAILNKLCDNGNEWVLDMIIY